MARKTQTRARHASRELLLDAYKRAFRRAGTAGLLAVALLGGFARPAAAQRKPPTASMALEQVVQQALAKNPQLQSPEDSAAAGQLRQNQPGYRRLTSAKV